MSINLTLTLTFLIIMSALTRVLTYLGPVKGENNIFAAVSHMEPLVAIEKRLVDIAKVYIKEQKRKLGELEPFAESVQEAINLSADKPDNYLGNPINSYLIIKRFTSGWKELSSRLDVDQSSLKDVETLIEANYMYMPSEKVDMNGATGAILRLMDNYDVTAREISEGKIEGLVPSLSQLTASDCYDIADIAHRSRRYVRMKEWLLEAERLVNDPTIPHRHGNMSRLLVNEYMSWSYYLEGDFKNALKYALLVLEDDPGDQKMLENKEIFSWYIERNDPSDLPETKYMEEARDILEKEQKSTYVQICKKKDIGYKKIWNLSCRYKQDLPILFLKPIKITQLHDNPEIYILHDILTEQQMDTLKEIATPRLRAATVVDPLDDTKVSAHYRVSKSMFLDPMFPADRKISEKLNPLFEALLGLVMVPGEEVQLNNYGLGGQYEAHHDYGEPGTLIANDPHGNRIATLLIYLSNVESGGETVFTELGLSVPPMKGSAIFWYNLHRNGTGYYNTMHASCPVISGSKWVANKWIHEKGNEFRRPCSLRQFE